MAKKVSKITDRSKGKRHKAKRIQKKKRMIKAKQKSRKR